MPQRDYYLTLSQAQSVLSTASTSLNSPFDTGQQVSSDYGRSPYQSTNLNAVKARLGQAVKKFFFQVAINSGMSGGTAATYMTIALRCGATAGANGWTTLFTTAQIPKPYLTAAAEALLCKVPIPDQVATALGGVALQRYIKGLYTIANNATALSKFKLDCELTLY